MILKGTRQVEMLSRLGLREQNKADKRQRIREAARELFSKHGYESATLRQIAKRAHVGLGTLFNYAQDKRDLVFLIFNEELAAVTEEALSRVEPHTSVVDQLSEIYKPHYEYFSQNPPLSRILLRELTFYSEGKQAATFHQIRERLISGIEKTIRSAQQERSILSREDAAFIALHIFFVCSGAIRWWIAHLNPSPRDGLAELRRLLELQVSGLQPAPPSNGRQRGSIRSLGHSPARRRDGDVGRKLSPKRTT
jgi:AcrR family transcriptional regulator